MYEQEVNNAKGEGQGQGQREVRLCGNVPWRDGCLWEALFEDLAWVWSQATQISFCHLLVWEPCACARDLNCYRLLVARAPNQPQEPRVSVSLSQSLRFYSSYMVWVTAVHWPWRKFGRRPNPLLEQAMGGTLLHVGMGWTRTLSACNGRFQIRPWVFSLFQKRIQISRNFKLVPKFSNKLSIKNIWPFNSIC